MDIGQNFDKNLKKAVKTQTATLPTDSKFILHQLVKNIDEVENMLENETIDEYNVGYLKQVIRNLNEAAECTYSFECKGGKICINGKCKKNPDGDSVSKDVEQEMDEATTTASSGAYETPRFWAKDKKNQRFATKRWMPDAKYVKVKDKCKKFPYCNQGDINALEIWEKEIMRESAKKVAKKTGKPESEVREMIEKELAEIIRRSFYKSPIKDLVGTGKMDTPIGKMLSMGGNKPKYES